MTELRDIVSRITGKLTEAGIAKYAVYASESEKHELNTEHEQFSLYRTIFDRKATVTAFLPDGRKGTANGNDLTETGLDHLIAEAKAGAESSVPDPANDIAPAEKPEQFTSGELTADMERYYDRLQEVISEVRTGYPKIRLMQIIASHTKSHSIYANANGTCFENTEGVYETGMEFAGNDGEKTTGIAFSGAAARNLAEPILSLGSMRRQLADTEKSLNTVPVGGKFEGTVILTPEANLEFTYMLLSNYIGGGVVMDGTSQWLKRLGEQVMSDKITLRFPTEDPRLAGIARWTGDGFRTEDTTVIDKGVLKGFLLDLYAANKTGFAPMKNASSLVMEPGDTPLADIIRGVKRGLIVGGFSGGQPGTNGEFSGVAKNSFYVEDGEIRGAVQETMISGNLADLYSGVTALSSEQVCDGGSAFPYLAAGGITISGK